MANGFNYESPFNKLLDEVIPRALDTLIRAKQQERELQQRQAFQKEMKMETQAFQRNEAEKNRKFRQEELFAREDEYFIEAHKGYKPNKRIQIFSSYHPKTEFGRQLIETEILAAKRDIKDINSTSGILVQLGMLDSKDSKTFSNLWLHGGKDQADRFLEKRLQRLYRLPEDVSTEVQMLMYEYKQLTDKISSGIYIGESDADKELDKNNALAQRDEIRDRILNKIRGKPTDTESLQKEKTKTKTKQKSTVSATKFNKYLYNYKEKKINEKFVASLANIAARKYGRQYGLSPNDFSNGGQYQHVMAGFVKEHISGGGPFGDSHRWGAAKMRGAWLRYVKNNIEK